MPDPTMADGTQRQWAEVDFVPGEAGENKDRKPLRYVGLRLLKPQGVIFNDGSDRRHHAVVTNLNWDGAKLLNWHREKAGTVEHAHHVLKNELAAAALPSGKFGANAAWCRLNVLTYNLLSALKRLALPGDLSQARPKRLRFLVFNTVGKVLLADFAVVEAEAADGVGELRGFRRFHWSRSFRIG